MPCHRPVVCAAAIAEFCEYGRVPSGVAKAPHGANSWNERISIASLVHRQHGRDRPDEMWEVVQQSLAGHFTSQPLLSSGHACLHACFGKNETARLLHAVLVHAEVVPPTSMHLNVHEHISVLGQLPWSLICIISKSYCWSCASLTRLGSRCFS